MGKLFADVFISLDGFASGSDEAAFFGCFGPELGNWVQQQLNMSQAILMGRVTYEALARFSASATDEVSTRMSVLPKAVCSNTLQEPLAWKNTRLIRGGVAEEIRALKQQNGNHLRTMGSIRLMKNLVKLGLVDRLRLMVFPVIRGKTGKEPIFADYPRIRLELVNKEALDSGLVLREYRPAASAR